MHISVMFYFETLCEERSYFLIWQNILSLLAENFTKVSSASHALLSLETMSNFTVPDLWRISCAIQGRTLDALVMWQWITTGSFHWVKPWFDLISYWSVIFRLVYFESQKGDLDSHGVYVVYQSETMFRLFYFCCSMIYTPFSIVFGFDIFFFIFSRC